MKWAKCGAAIGAVVATFVAVTAAPAYADPIEDFYKDKQITVLVGFGAGGGYDATTRLLAKHFSKHMPGHPTMIVQNMPGAGSMKVAINLYQVTPKDGSVLGVFASSTALEPLFGNKQATYDPRRYEWLGSLHRDIASCGVWKGAGQNVRSLPDLINAKTTVTFGSTSPTAITSQHVLFLKHMFNANVKVIYGYGGTRDVSLAMMRGELNGSCGMFESSVRGAFAQSVESGDFKIVVQFGRDRKVPYFGGATQMYTLLKTDDDRKLADVVFGSTEIARPVAAPPGTPPDRVAALSKALMETMHDPDMLADGKRLHIDFDPIPGEEVAQMFAGFYSTPPALVAKARAFIQPDK